MRRALTAALALFTLVFVAFEGGRETLHPRVDLPEQNPTARYSALLVQVVTFDGYVDYEELEKQRGVLDEYVAWIAHSRAWRLERPVDRPADYLNAYNALVLYQVLERGRPDSVLNVTGWLPVPGARFFKTTQFKVGRERVTLSEMMHERIRNAMLDYRVHAAMTRASMSSPPMRNELYVRRSLVVQLRHQMTRWMNDERGVRFDGHVPVFNSIFREYARDFEFWSAGQSLCEIASRNAAGELRQRLLGADATGCKHRFAEHDWALNDRRLNRD